MPSLEVDFLVDVDETVDGICRKYWETDPDGTLVHTVSSIAQMYSLRSGDVSKIVKEACEAVIADSECARCSDCFRVGTRAELANFMRRPKEKCDDCLEDLARLGREQAAEVDSLRRANLDAEFSIEDDAVAVDARDLPLSHAFALATLFEEVCSDGSGRSEPVDKRESDLAPTVAFSMNLVESLRAADLIRIHPLSPSEAFQWDGVERVGGLYPLRLSYYLVGSGPLATRVSEYLQSFRQIQEHAQWPAHWVDQLPEFWTEFMQHECELYLLTVLMDRGFDFSPGDGTRDAIRRGLERFTPGQVYYFIYRAARAASDRVTRRDVGKRQAANGAITQLSSEIDRAYAEGWTVSEYRRPRGAEESSLWRLLMVRALSLAEPLAYSPVQRSARPHELKWDVLDSQAFERLIFRLVDEAEDYEGAGWLMRTNAPDHGRDVSAFRVIHDSLSGSRRVRVAVQCKHWLSKSLRDTDISAEVVSIDHWQDPPFEVMVVATSGRFTAGAVTWVERHNAKGNRPYIEMWSDSHLESLLAERPHLVLSFKLR